MSSTPWALSPTPDHAAYTGGGRDPVIAEALARLAIATELRHTSAAARVLDDLTATEPGTWLLTQMAAASLRALSAGLQTLPPEGSVAVPRTVGSQGFQVRR